VFVVLEDFLARVRCGAVRCGVLRRDVRCGVLQCAVRCVVPCGGDVEKLCRALRWNCAVRCGAVPCRAVPRRAEAMCCCAVLRCVLRCGGAVPCRAGAMCSRVVLCGDVDLLLLVCISA